jgi:hypothetical protein
VLAVDPHIHLDGPKLNVEQVCIFGWDIRRPAMLGAIALQAGEPDWSNRRCPCENGRGPDKLKPVTYHRAVVAIAGT